jgi:hypothetical protein
MNIVNFYKRLSKLLEDYREEKISYNEALKELRDLMQLAEDSNLEVNISEDILKLDNISKYDDERSYESTSYDEYSSYDDEDYDGYQSSY